MFKQRDSHETIKDVVLAHVGMSEREFMIPQAHYHINLLKEAAQMLKNVGGMGQIITVVGDYDVDGIAATSILSLVFKHLGWKFNVRLPKRFSEGYGISDAIIDEIGSILLILNDVYTDIEMEIEKKGSIKATSKYTVTLKQKLFKIVFDILVYIAYNSKCK